MDRGEFWLKMWFLIFMATIVITGLIAGCEVCTTRYYTKNGYVQIRVPGHTEMTTMWVKEAK